MEKVLSAATPYLEGRTIKDLIIGLALISCELDNGDVGVSYVLREGLSRGCSRFPFFQKMTGQPAFEVAKLSISGKDDLQRGVAASVLAAASHGLEIPDDGEDSLFGLNIQSGETVGMVGLISPVAKKLSRTVEQLIVFDKGLSMDEGESYLYPMEKQAQLLPKCDIVLISGTTTINGSLDSLLEMCSNARDIVLLGPSTPMFPEGYKDSPITHLAGSFWTKEHKNEIFRSISLAGGIKSIEKYMIKKNLKINNL